THVASAAQALEMAKAERRYNLIITVPDPGDLDATALAREVRSAGLDVPVVVLAFDNNERKAFMATYDYSAIEPIFLWQGDARIALARRVRGAAPDLPILLQSSRERFASGAREVGAAFLRKYSDTLLADLGRFMTEHFAFGDFVFRLPDGTEVDRASDLKSL